MTGKPRHTGFISRTLRPWWRLTRGLTLGAQGVVVDANSNVLLVRHGYRPGWYFPGGGVERNETLLIALARELKEETGIDVCALTLVGVYSDPNRDPRGHTCSVAYLARTDSTEPIAGDDAAAAEWVADWRSVTMAFDHAQILEDAEGALSRL